MTLRSTRQPPSTDSLDLRAENASLKTSPMPPLSRPAQLFILRGLFCASVVYLAVALFILRPINRFGLAHSAWAVVCVGGSWRAFQAARRGQADGR